MCFRSFLFMKEAGIIYQEGVWEVGGIGGRRVISQNKKITPHSAPTSACNIKHRGGKKKQYLSL